MNRLLLATRFVTPPPPNRQPICAATLHVVALRTSLFRVISDFYPPFADCIFRTSQVRFRSHSSVRSGQKPIVSIPFGCMQRTFSSSASTPLCDSYLVMSSILLSTSLITVHPSTDGGHLDGTGLGPKDKGGGPRPQHRCLGLFREYRYCPRIFSGLTRCCRTYM